jgi:hypothetical protein
MTGAVVSSASKEVVIGFERPFCIIGKRINPTGRKRLAAQMAAGDYSQVEADAQAQVAAGAHMLDLNAGIPLADEPRILAETVQLVQSLVDVPLSIDSSIVAALEAGLAVYRGKPLVNSVTGEDERLEASCRWSGSTALPSSRSPTTHRHSRGPGRVFRGGAEDRGARGMPHQSELGPLAMLLNLRAHNELAPRHNVSLAGRPGVGTCSILAA